MRKINYNIEDIFPYQKTECLQVKQGKDCCDGCMFNIDYNCKRPDYLLSCCSSFYGHSYNVIYSKISDPQILNHRKYRRIYYDITTDGDDYNEIIHKLVELGGTLNPKVVKTNYGYYYINAYGIISYSEIVPEKYVRYTLSDDINDMPSPEFVGNYYYVINPDNKTAVKNRLIELGGLYDIDMDDSDYKMVWINSEWQIYATESTDPTAIYDWVNLKKGNCDELLDFELTDEVIKHRRFCIQGNYKLGSKIITIFNKLGAMNPYNRDGKDSSKYYFISSKGEIGARINKPYGYYELTFPLDSSEELFKFYRTINSFPKPGFAPTVCYKTTRENREQIINILSNKYDLLRTGIYFDDGDFVHIDWCWQISIKDAQEQYKNVIDGETLLQSDYTKSQLLYIQFCFKGNVDKGDDIINKLTDVFGASNSCGYNGKSDAYYYIDATGKVAVSETIPNGYVELPLSQDLSKLPDIDSNLVLDLKAKGDIDGSLVTNVDNMYIRPGLTIQATTTNLLKYPEEKIMKQKETPQLDEETKNRYLHRKFYAYGDAEHSSQLRGIFIALLCAANPHGLKCDNPNMIYFIDAYGNLGSFVPTRGAYVEDDLVVNDYIEIHADSNVSEVYHTYCRPQFLKKVVFQVNSEIIEPVIGYLVLSGGQVSNNDLYASKYLKIDSFWNIVPVIGADSIDFVKVTVEEFKKNVLNNSEKEEEINTQINKITDLKSKNMSNVNYYQNNEVTMQKKQSMFKTMFDKIKEQFAITKEESLRLATDGSICVPVNNEYIAINASNKLVSYPSNLCFNCPVFVMTKPFAQIMVGDIIKDKESFYKVISKKENGSLSVLSYTGTMKNKTEVKDFLLNSAFAKVVINMFNSMGNNPINPMMLAMMNESENGNKTDMKEMMMLMMMMSGNNPFAAMSGNNTAGANPMMNPMMMMAMMGDNSNQSSMMEMFMMSQMMGGNNIFNPAVVSQSPVTKKKRRCARATSASTKPTVK